MSVVMAAATVDLSVLGIIGGFIASVVGAFALASKLGPEKAKLQSGAELEQAQADEIGLKSLQSQIDLWKKMLEDRTEEMRKNLADVREEMLRAKEEAALAKTEAAKSRESAAAAYTMQAQAEARLAEAERRHSEERHTLRNQIIEAEAARMTLENRVRELEQEVARLTGAMAARRATDQRGPEGMRGAAGLAGPEGPRGPAGPAATSV